MDDERSKASTFAWTDAQRRVLIAGLLALLVFLSIQLFLWPMYVPDPQPEMPPRYADLADRIDPNTADAAALAALPMIGPGRAADIVKFREQYNADHPGEHAFKTAEDLLRIDGVGTAMLESVEPYLIFPSEHRPGGATQPIIDRD